LYPYDIGCFKHILLYALIILFQTIYYLFYFKQSHLHL
jgi:hypothetical protein